MTAEGVSPNIELGSLVSVPSFINKPILWPALIYGPKTIKQRVGRDDSTQFER
jgi:hypothetical protein